MEVEMLENLSWDDASLLAWTSDGRAKKKTDLAIETLPAGALVRIRTHVPGSLFRNTYFLEVVDPMERKVRAFRMWGRGADQPVGHDGMWVVLRPVTLAAGQPIKYAGFVRSVGEVGVLSTSPISEVTLISPDIVRKIG